MASQDQVWWKEGVIYQVYPASFKDSNGDGLGDIPGIKSKIDYLKDLGVDTIWICPMYASPQHDMGYDISDYQSVHAPYGTVKDIDELIEACHSRGMRLILDLVINHTSDEHEWFKESRSSQDNPKRDWYIWKPAKFTDDGVRMPPNNWRSFFGGSAWEWDEATQEYYLHLYAVQQPDLNWENETTRKELYENAVEFWLRKGIDGFRIDCVNMYSKVTDYPDAPIVNKGFAQPATKFFCNGPRIHEFLRELNTVLSKYDTVAVGELPFTPDFKEALRYVSAKDKQLSMVLQFDLIVLGQGKSIKFEYEDWKISQMKNIIEKLQTFIEGTDGWTTSFLENHDHGRSITRLASDAPKWRERSAKMLAIMSCALTGTLFIYQGQEIGMINAPKDWPIEEYRDIETMNHYKAVTTDDPKTRAHAMKCLQILARDHGRFPMQWNDSEHAGFSTQEPWMRPHPSYPEINVANQVENSSSVLSFWKRMLQLRKQYKDIFIYGTFIGYDMESEKTFSFGKANKAMVFLNFTETPQEFRMPSGGSWELLVSNVDGVDATKNILSGYEGRIYLNTKALDAEVPAKCMPVL
ncbi:BgTH12-02886 [Blumeria graminis f. sp. triticale]|uniref:Alpha-glucosidase n=3 Tax=Blumeria graminis TaxID=34373 RepID=A0A381LAC0_BLUGR|nr:Maltase (alpha-D-glucosidase) inducible protein [Blumeria graminis f. sp. tritici 96224]CAD6503218.1 BgTH12-02886 [Blumeria graminis f. sp. triticale]VDB89193.1 Bgt-927 [Blumeria graminis f. sp. tritici]